MSDVRTRDDCPKCGADWRAGEIPEEHRESYGGKTHFLRCVAMYDRNRDRTVAIVCPDCKESFPA